MTDDKHKAEKDLGKGVATATTGALIGAAIGGPAGAVVGGAVGPFADYLLQARKRQIERAERLAEISATMAGVSLDDLFVKMNQDPQVSDLGLKLLEIAAKSESADRDNAMAALLAEAINNNDSTKNDQYPILAEILSTLKQPHIQLLLHISSNAPCEPTDLVQRFKQFESIVRSLVRTLELHGLILDDNRLSTPPTNEIRWTTSDIGEGLVQIINAAKASEN